MTNPYYNHDDGYPSPGAQGASASMRSELDKVAAGFELLPDALAAATGAKVFLAELQAATLTTVNALTAFSANYDDCEIHLDGLLPTTTASNLQLQIAVAGVGVTTATYLNAANSSVSATASQVNLTNDVVLQSGRGLNGKILISNVNAVPGLKSVTGMTAWQKSASNYDGLSFQAFNTTGAVVTGFLLKWDTGVAFTSGFIRIYGIRKN